MLSRKINTTTLAAAFSDHNAVKTQLQGQRTTQYWGFNNNGKHGAGRRDGIEISVIGGLYASNKGYSDSLKQKGKKGRENTTSKQTSITRVYTISYNLH
jgi:hypothetical protein